MKRIVALLILALALNESAFSQIVNWRSLSDDQHNIVQLGFGYDYGVTAHVGYRRAVVLIAPVLLGVDYSVPMGNNLLDDFKLRLGGEIEVVRVEGFSATLRIMSILRRYQNDFVRIVSFGSDFSATVGYFHSAWYAAGEFGFDKSITSHLKHSDTIKKYVFAGIRDGWYIPTGGHYYYGIQGGKTIGETFDVSLRVGATDAQGTDGDAVVPYYVQLALGVRF